MQEEPSTNSVGPPSQASGYSPPVSTYASDVNSYTLDTIEVHDQAGSAPVQSATFADQTPNYRPVTFSRRKAVIVSLFITLVAVGISGASLSLLSRGKQSNNQQNSIANQIPTQQVALNAASPTTPSELTGSAASLLVNGDVITKGSLKVTSGSYVSAIHSQDLTSNQSYVLPDASGTICLSTNNCGDASLQQLDQTNATVALLQTQLGQIIIPTVPSSSLVNGQTGAVTVQGTTNQITVTNGSHSITLSTPQDLAAISSPTFAGLALNGNLNITGTVTLPINCSALINGGKLTTDSSGQIICDIDQGGAGSGNVSTGTGTVGTIPVYTAGQTIADSIISQALGTVTVNGSLKVTGLGNGFVKSTAGTLSVVNLIDLSSDVTGTLAVGNGGTGATTLTAGGVLLGNGGGAISATGVLANGQLLIGDGSGAPTIGTLTQGTGIIVTNGVGTITIASTLGTSISNGEIDPDAVTLGAQTTGNYVANLGALTGLTTTGNSGEGSTPTLAVQYGAAANNAAAGANTFTCPSGTGNLNGGGTVVTIGTSGTTCASLNTVASPTFTGTLTVQGATTTIGTNVLQGSLILKDGSSNNGIIQTAALGQDTTYTLPDPGAASASICLSTGNCVGGAGGSAPNTAAYLTIGGDPTLTNERSIVAGTNLGFVDGGANGNYTLNVVNSPTFSGTLIVQGASATIGTNVQQGSLILKDGSSNNGTVQTAPLGQDTTYTLPDPGSASVSFCLTSNNCAGLGGGVSTAGGTNNRLPVFNGAQTIANSWLAQNGTALELDATRNLSLLGGNLSVTGNGTFTGTLSASNFSGTVNGVTLSSAGVSQFTVSGGSPTSRTLTVTGSDVSVNQNLLTTSNVNFNQLTLATALTVGNGGTGLTATPTNGQLLIGNGSGLSLNSLASADHSVVITPGAGTIDLSAPNAGSCNGCANKALSNLASVAINTSLLSGGSGVDLGSSTAAFQNLYLYGSGSYGTDRFQITGTPTGNKTITLDNKDGTVALLQTAGSSLAQTGDINATGTLIAGTALQGTLLKTADVAGATSSLAIRSGNSSGSSSGNVTIDAGSASTTTGSITVGGSNASALTLGRNTLSVSIPGGFSTAGGNANLGSGTITSGNINSQTISSTANFTGTLAIQGANALTLGTSSSNTGAIIFDNLGGANTVSLKASNSNPASSFSITLPSSLPGSTSCLTLDNGGQVGTQSCSSGLGGGGTANTIALFGAGGTSVANSLLTQSGSVVSLLGATNNAALAVGTSITVGANGASNAVAGQLVLNDGSNPGRAVSLQAQPSGSSYTLELPTTADVGSTCLTLTNVSAGVDKIAAGSCAAGGAGGNVNLSGSTNGFLLRGTNNGPSYTAAASLIQDDGSGIGVNTAPIGGTILTVGSSNAFKVTDAGAISASASITSSGLIQTSASAQALTLSGAPGSSAVQSLLQIGGAIASGNSTPSTGGTYIGLNAPNAGAGSTADFINLEKNGVSKLLVTTAGDITAGKLNGLTLAQGASQFTINGGSGTPRTLTVSGDSTINQDLSTTSSTVQFGKIAGLTTKLEAAQGGTGADLSGSLAGAVAIFNATTGKFAGARLRSSDASLTITSTDGDVNLQVSSCSSCANNSLNNLSGTTSINSSLLAQSAKDIGSATNPFRNIYLYGTGTYGSNSLELTSAPTGNNIINFPNVANDTVCVLTANNCNFQASGNYVKLSPGSSQSGFIDVTGNVNAATFNNLMLTRNVDGFSVAGGSTTSRNLTVTGSDVTLNQSLRTTDNVGFGNVAAGGTLSVTSTSGFTGQATFNGGISVAGGQSVTLQSGSGTFTQTYTGTADANSITANSLTTGTAFKVTSSNNTAGNTSWNGVQFNLTNAQGTTAVSTGNIYGADFEFNQNTSIAGNNEAVANFAIKQNNSSSTDATVASILNLANNDTATGNQITATDGIKINGANITNGIDLSGSFVTNLITSSNFTVAQSGLITGVGVAAGTGQITGTGGLSLTGATTINNSGSGTTTIGNTSNATVINLQSTTGNINLTTNGSVNIGTTADAVATFLNIDQSSGASDPGSGMINGSMYYNTTMGAFRCYQANAWKNCDVSGPGANGALAKDAADTSTISATGNLYAFTNNSSGAAGVLSLTNAGTNSALSVTQTGNPTLGTQAVIFANNTNGTPAGNLIDLQAGSSSKFKVSATGQVSINADGSTPTADLSFGSTGAAGNRTINIITQTASNTAGDSLTVISATGNGTGAGGATTLQGGSGGATSGAGGLATIQGGNAAAGNSNGGGVSLLGGTATGTGVASAITVTAGNAASGNTAGGVINITSGTGSGTAAGGLLTIGGGTGGANNATGGASAGAGAGVTINTGNGGAETGASGANTGGAGGTFTLSAGTGGSVTSATGIAGAGGGITLQAGTGGTGGANTAHASGNGGVVTFKGGSAGASTNGDGGNVILQGGAKAGTGSEGSVIVKPQNDAVAFQIQASGAAVLLSADTTSNKLIKIGTGTSTLTGTTGALFVSDSVEALGQILIGTSANGVNIDSTNHQIRYNGNARNTKKITLTPEYAGAVFDTSGGGTHVGSLTAGFDGTQRESYYQWTTSQAGNNDYDVVVSIPIPSDWSQWSSTTPFSIDVKTSDTTNGITKATLTASDGTVEGSCTSATLTHSGTGWLTDTSNCVLGSVTTHYAANGVMTLRLHIQAQNSGTTQLGNIVISYLSAF